LGLYKDEGVGKIGYRSRRSMGISRPSRQLKSSQFGFCSNWLALICIHICMLMLIVCQPACFAANKIKVALFEDRGASAPAKRNFETVLSNSDDIQFQTIYGDDIADGSLQGFDALIMPGGSASKQAISLGPQARAEVRRFVRDGGIYMGVCAGAYLSSEAQDNYLALLPLTTLDQKHWYRVDDGTPVNVELTPAGMDVFGVNTRNINIVYENGPIFAPPTQKVDDSFTPLGFFRSEVVADGGQRGVMLGAPAMILSRYGRGIVLAISPHPEKTPGLKQMITRALRWMYEHRTS
jgi:putative intracellular protease/amidase